jgi:hypothetical protein
MKTASIGLLSAIGFAVTIFFGAPVQAASELGNRDAAFSLLIEAFGEVQSSFIENDYQTQLQVAGSIPDSVSRRQAFELARQEHDLRLGKLKRQLTQMALAYHYSRQTDERVAAVNEPEKIDPAAAARSLSGFVLIGAEAVQADGETNTPEPTVVIQRPPWRP